MYDELTEVDIQKMQEEINYRSRPPAPPGISARIMNINAPSRRKTAMTAASAIWNG